MATEATSALTLGTGHRNSALKPFCRCNLGVYDFVISVWLMSRSLLNIAKRSLLRLMLSCVGLASKHAAG